MEILHEAKVHLLSNSSYVLIRELGCFMGTKEYSIAISNQWNNLILLSLIIEYWLFHSLFISKLGSKLRVSNSNG